MCTSTNIFLPLPSTPQEKKKKVLIKIYFLTSNVTKNKNLIPHQSPFLLDSIWPYWNSLQTYQSLISTSPSNFLHFITLRNRVTPFSILPYTHRSTPKPQGMVIQTHTASSPTSTALFPLSGTHVPVSVYFLPTSRSTSNVSYSMKSFLIL